MFCALCPAAPGLIEKLLDIPHRADRTRFLVSLGLARHHPLLFQGMPYAIVSGLTVNGLLLDGHIAQQIGGNRASVGEDIFRLRDSGLWSPGETDRRRFVAHLCCAVQVLEELDLVHGDISPRNVMIATDDDGQPVAVLCDFDAFNHPEQLALPFAFQGQPCRSVGTPGFQHPTLIRALAAGSQHTVVRSDRFALAALACEIMAWEGKDADRFGRDALLDETVITARNAMRLPSEIRSRWPEGFELLDRALQMPPAAAPGPRDWLTAAGFDVDDAPSARDEDVPFLVRISTVHGYVRQQRYMARLVNQTGAFGQLDPTLAPVEFRVNGHGLELRFGWSFPMFHLNADAGTPARSTNGWIGLKLGQTVRSNGWEFEVLP